MNIFANKILLLCLFGVLGLVGCGDKEGRDSTAKSNASAFSFEDYLLAKGLNAAADTEREQLQRDYNLLQQQIRVIESGTFDTHLFAAKAELYRQESLLEYYVLQESRDATVDANLRAYYQAHIDQYQTQRFKLAHILIIDNASNNNSAIAAGDVLAEQLREKLQAGANFQSLVAQYSDDPVSKRNSGELGWLPTTFIADTYSPAITRLESGEYSDVVKSKFGFHIFKVIEGPQTITKPFVAVRADIKQKMKQEARQKVLAKLTAD